MIETLTHTHTHAVSLSDFYLLHTTDVLDLDKLEKGKMDFESIEFRLGDLLDSIMCVL